MILDILNCFTSVLSTGAVKQAITATAASTNVIDLGAGDAGKSQHGAPILLVTCRDAFTNLTSLGIKLQTADDAAFTTPVDLPISQTVLLAGLTKDTEILKQILPIGCKRYVRLYFTVTGTAPDAGSIEAFLIWDTQASF